MSTLYASFVNPSDAERAAGALLDHGAVAADISVIANEAYNSIRAVNANVAANDAEASAKTGISTTTPADVAAGAVKGATVGIGVGIVAALASIFVPGLGLIIGGGALATAMAGGAATVLAGTAAGGVVGYLRDQGMSEDMISTYSDNFVKGGAILAIAIPTGDMPVSEVEAILIKYGAMNVATYNSAKVLIDDPTLQAPKVPLVVDNPNIDPIAVSPAVEVFETAPVTNVTRVVDAATGDTTVVASVDPVTAPVAGAIVDPVTGVARPVIADVDAAQVPAVTRVVDASTGETRVVTRTEPVAAPAVAVIVDPITGIERPATEAEIAAGLAVVPVQKEVVVEETVVPRDSYELY